MNRLLDYTMAYRFEMGLQDHRDGRRKTAPAVGEVCRALFWLTPGKAQRLATPENCGDKWPQVFDALWSETPQEAVSAFRALGWDATHRNRAPALCAPIFLLPATLATLGIAGRLPPITAQGWAAEMEKDARRFQPRPQHTSSPVRGAKVTHNGKCFRVLSPVVTRQRLA